MRPYALTMTNPQAGPSLLEGPTLRAFPLWTGQDTTFVVNRKDSSGAYLDYEPGTTAKVVFIVNKLPLEFEAVISGHSARFLIDDAAVAEVKPGSKWRLQFTVNGHDKAPIIGTVVRRDA